MLSEYLSSMYPGAQQCCLGWNCPEKPLDTLQWTFTAIGASGWFPLRQHRWATWCLLTCLWFFVQGFIFPKRMNSVTPEPGGPGGPGGPLAPPIFGGSVNPIRTGGGQIIPNYTTAPKLKAIQWGTTFSDMGSDNWLILAFFKLELWNFQDILDLWFREASQNLNLFRHFFS